jgi:AcrR family transcriptional regulator
MILDAAERRFAERGFAGVSVREIAADVGLRNQASLYHHFRNKRALYEAVLSRGVEAIVALVASSPLGGASDGASPESGLTDATLDRVIDYLIEHPHLPRLIQRAGLDDTRFLRSPVTHLLRPMYAQGLKVLSGTAWDPEELPQVAAGFYHLIFGYFANAKLLETVIQADPLSPANVERQRRFLKSAAAHLLAGGHSDGQARAARGSRRT